MLYKYTREQLKRHGASEFKDGDIISTGKYYIFIKYISRDKQRTYDTPTLCSYIEQSDGGFVGCTPGQDRPYYLDKFLHR
jgi:hypothetical protein